LTFPALPEDQALVRDLEVVVLDEDTEAELACVLSAPRGKAEQALDAFELERTHAPVRRQPRH